MIESVLTVLASTFLGGLAGYLVGRWQDRARNRDRLKGVAGALWADLQRIREELGEPLDRIIELQVYGSTPIPPQVHEWVRTLIPETADIHPEVLLHCFHLDRALHNYDVSVRALRDTSNELANRRDQFKDLDEKQPQESSLEEEFDPEEWFEEWKGKDDLKREIRGLEERGELWEHSAVESRKRAHRLMDRIDDRLLDYLPAERQIEFVEAGRDAEGQTELFAGEPPPPES